ncbi:hypothetical protein [Halobacterium salinarum]|uniref:Uncharacterized protein n=1 Tax=Halobacterium salinarum (strain ATCC 33171 / DSM 3754 / JCM 8978 / NBRC 102687 / NCIMB 764 / 91-R6) TaxID=2597657 RepID=A0A4D6GZB9_HALS9|nr:hypothetical protein [Halobacterium salinarum]QCC45807.1 uncharacterized protein HBSAL_10825 [Halobacterium salinarum]TYO82065.1 hypothetical protein APQ99_00583 [Halobacterium salinarum DSM 3754]
MRVAFGERVRRGRAVDLRNEGVPASAVVAAITDPDDGRVRGQRPAAVHEHVGVLCEGTTLRVGVALAAAARSRGARTTHDDELAAVTRQLAGLSTPDVDLAAARERVAAAEVAVGHMRERAARVQGRTQPGDGEPVVAVTRALTAVETEWHAAKERLRRAQAAWADARRRLSLEDRRANLEQAARDALVARWSDRFRRAMDALAVPASVPPSQPPRRFSGPPWAGAAAIARLAAPGAPLVVSAAVCADALAASAALDAPVVVVAD